VARITVRQAVDVLRKEDLLYCRQGRGTFVVGKTRDRRWLKLATDWQSLADSLKGNVPRLIAARGAAAVSPMLATEDGKSAGAYVFLRSVQYKDGEPYGIVNLHLAQSVYDLCPAEFRARPALSILADLPQVRVKTARQSISVGGADPEVADLLQVALGAPTVKCRCIITDVEDIAVYIADIIYRSDCVRIEVDLLSGRGVS
jgi:GntR family transcriptional regulator